MSDSSLSSDQVSTAVRCSYQDCHCTFSLAEATRKDGRLFCSSGCAEGTGCNHPDCACARTIALGHGAE